MVGDKESLNKVPSVIIFKLVSVVEGHVFATWHEWMSTSYLNSSNR